MTMIIIMTIMTIMMIKIDDDQEEYDDHDQTWMALLRSTSGIARDCSTVPKEVIIRLK